MGPTSRCSGYQTHSILIYYASGPIKTAHTFGLGLQLKYKCFHLIKESILHMFHCHSIQYCDHVPFYCDWWESQCCWYCCCCCCMILHDATTYCLYWLVQLVPKKINETSRKAYTIWSNHIHWIDERNNVNILDELPRVFVYIVHKYTVYEHNVLTGVLWHQMKLEHFSQQKQFFFSTLMLCLVGCYSL